MTHASQQPTFCRICEPACSMLATMGGDGRVIELRPDPASPDGGTACHKGLSYLDVHRDPDRLNWPLRRDNGRDEPQGRFERVSWDSALADIGRRLRALRERHGADSIAVYAGNPSVFNASGVIYAEHFQDMIGTRMKFCAATQDTSNRMISQAAVYGTYAALMVPDLLNTDYLLVLGGNPRVSRWTMASVPNDVDILKNIVRRGGKVRFVNPRRIESSTPETGPTLRIRPGTDVYFLAALLHEMDRCDGFDLALIERHGKHLDGLRAFIAPYAPERVAAVTGLSASAIREIAHELMAARSASVYMSTGVNQSRQGVLCGWLVEMINFVSSNLGRDGGTYHPRAFLENLQPVGGTTTLATSLGPIEVPEPSVPGRTLPATLLPDLIEAGDIRALIVIGGNPLLSTAGEQHLRAACNRLELMVCVDIFRTATAELCDYVLPATDWLERADINLFGSGMQLRPNVKFSDALVPPAAERHNERWILSRLLTAMGLPSPMDAGLPDLDDTAAMLQDLVAAGGLTLEQLRAAPSRTVMLQDTPKDTLFERCVLHADRRIDCCPAQLESAGLLQRCTDLFAELEREAPHRLRLISLRTTHMHNSWLANSQRLRHGEKAFNALHMCEQDAAARGLHDGDGVTVASAHGQVDTVVLIDDDLRPGAVAMSHGYGHRQAYGLGEASRKPGVNVNRLMPVGPGAAEPLSHMSWLSAIPVEVSRREQRRPGAPAL